MQGRNHVVSLLPTTVVSLSQTALDSLHEIVIPLFTLLVIQILPDLAGITVYAGLLRALADLERELEAV